MAMEHIQSKVVSQFKYVCFCIMTDQSMWHEDLKLQCTESSYITSKWVSAVMRPTSEQYSVSPDSGMPVIPVAFSAVMLCCNW